MPPRKPTGTGPSGRGLTVRVKTAKRRSVSSARWLQRQLNDPYVAEAQRRGFRSRAAFKLIQIDEKFGLLRRGLRVVDLGEAPGGWTQIAVYKEIGRASCRKRECQYVKTTGVPVTLKKKKKKK